MLEADAVEVRYGDRIAVHGASLTAARGEVVCILGPSGSGKTSLLRVIAGLEAATAGAVRWDGHDLADVPAHRRGFGLVFQDFALFPHRDVAGNVAFGLRMQGVRRPEIQRRVAEVLRLVGLDGYERRSTATLSGGELQRVALARALAPNPGLLLLDEPLGSLDRPLRERLTAELRSLFHDLDVAVVYVTHDQHEALALADRVVLLRSGRIAQVGSPAEVWRRPADEFVARFLGFANLVPTDVVDGTMRLPWGDEAAPAGAPAGGAVLVLPPDALTLSRASGFAGTVRAVSFRGMHFVTTVEAAGGTRLEVPVAADELPAVGATVHVSIDLRRATVVPRSP